MRRISSSLSGKNVNLMGSFIENRIDLTPEQAKK